MRKLYVAIFAIVMISAVTALMISAENSDAADDATIVCYIDDSTDSNFSFKGTVNVKAYLLTGTVGSTSLKDYSLISSSSSIADAENVKKVVLSNINTATPLDASKVFICFDIGNYTVGTMQTEFFDTSKTVKIADTDNKRNYSFYNLSSEFTEIESGNTYYIGSDNKVAVGVNFVFAEGTITGSVTGPEDEKIVGAEVSITDSERGKTKTVLTDANGAYSLTYYAGKYTLNINASKYKISTPEVNIYDNLTYDASVNKLDPIKLTAESKTATIIGYISNTDDTSFEKVTNIDISLYYQKGTEYELLSSTKTIETVTTNDGTHYKFTLNEIPKKSVSNTYLCINMTGYSVGMVQTACINPEPYNLVIQSTTYIAYKFNTDMFTTGYFEPGEYRIGSENMPGIQMKSAKGTITGKVTTDTSTPAALNGVTVSIYDTKTKALIASGITSDNGSYSIICSTGYYNITASINDYKTYEGNVTVYDDQYNPQLNIQPDIRLSPSEALFGTDLPHVLMIMGAIVALILIVIVTIHRLKFFGKKIDIYEDEKDEKE